MKWDASQYDSVKAPQIDAGRELISLAGIRENDLILDLGCGTGRLTLTLAHLAKNGDVTGIDSSPEMLGEAKRKCSASNNISYKFITAQSMKFGAEFDLVFSNSALQWIKEQEAVINLVFRSLREGGRIAFQLPSRDFCVEFFDYTQRAIEVLGLAHEFKGWETPWYLPSKEGYRNMLLDAGFENIKVYYRNYDIFFECIKNVLDWWTSAGLRPYLERLDDEQQEYFKYAFSMNFEKKRTARGIEFNFRRLFAFAEKY